VSRHFKRVVVSVGTGACLLFATVASALAGSHGEVPAYALYSSVVFYLERCLAVFLLTYVPLAVVVRSVIGGELPSAISKEGLTWSEEVSGATKEAIESLRAQFETLEHDVHELAERAALGSRLP